jgi:hypothetical protein
MDQCGGHQTQARILTLKQASLPKILLANRLQVRFVVTVLQGGEPMSGELEITTQDGKTYWFGRDERFPAEVRIYGADTHHWQYLPTERARQIVRESLENGGKVQQGDPLLFFTDQEQAPG